MFMRNNAKYIATLFFIVETLVSARLAIAAENSINTSRPSHWAQPLEREGLPNLHKVTDMLYRGAQPTAGGMRLLKAMGIKTVINLRSFHSDGDEIADTGLEYEHIYMKAWHPERKEIVRFLQIVTDPSCTPVFVHCQHGADRTGLMCAIFRVALCGWNKDQAIKEMTEGGFGFHKIWRNIVRYLENLDIETIKHEAGIDKLGSDCSRQDHVGEDQRKDMEQTRKGNEKCLLLLAWMTVCPNVMGIFLLKNATRPN
jgi:protein tyrosine phosphatase (PTP) superfamily phosphohydrolase (DUF442 family)